MPIPIREGDLPPVIWQRVQRNTSLLKRHRPIQAEALAKLRQQFRLWHTYNSNAIEGNTLSLRETQLVLEEGMTIGGKSLREHLEAANTAAAFDRVWEVARKGLRLDHVILQEVHGVVIRGISEYAGRYRTHNVRIGGADHAPPQPSKIIRMLDQLFLDLETDADPVIKSIFLHHRLVFIHPFLDGNGRVTRLAANLMLLSDGYPPIVLRAADRMRYYDCSRRADRGDYVPFAAFVLRAVDESLTVYLSAVEDERALIPLSELARNGPYSQEYLSLRARQGILEAVKIGDVWHSSRVALSEYIKWLRERR